MPVLEDGQLFERYRVIRWLGNGSSGESYEADDRMLMRKVTLKLIHPWATLPDSARRQFFREMQGVSTLNHRFLAPVLDYGEIDGRIYVARRYVSSGSLLSANGRLWFRPPLSIIDVCQYAGQLAQALHSIHQRGYTHGSLTFANVLVLRGPNQENEADYAPFLLADVNLSSFVRRFGKAGIEALPVSAAPEQIGQRTMPASDQFALGVLVYFWLAGHPPYLGTPAEVEQQKVKESILPLSSRNPAVTEEQDQIIRRALKHAPADRYASSISFIEALRASLTPTQRGQSIQRASAAQAPAPLPPSPPVTRTSSLPETPLPLSFQQETGSVGEPARPERTTAAAETKGNAEEASSLSALEQLLALPRITGTLSELSPVTPAPPAPVPQVAMHPAFSPLESLEGSASPGQSVPSVPSGTGQPQLPVSGSPSVPISADADGASPADQVVITPRLLVSPPYEQIAYEFLLTKAETTIGRAGSSDLLLDSDNMTSRHHAMIQRINERVLIFDKRSNNGVFVNGQQIAVGEGYELVDGDHITIGSYELVFRDTLPRTEIDE